MSFISPRDGAAVRDGALSLSRGLPLFIRRSCDSISLEADEMLLSGEVLKSGDATHFACSLSNATRPPTKSRTTTLGFIAADWLCPADRQCLIIASTDGEDSDVRPSKLSPHC